MSNREVFIDKLRQLSKEEMLERYVALLNTEKLTDYVADLEAKLAESERALEAKESVNQMYKATLNLKDSDFSDLVRENAKLKQQLGEKEKERELDNSFWKQECDSLQKALAEKEKEVERLREINLDVPIKQMQFHHNQDKISFAVEQLEKARECFIDAYAVCKNFSDLYWNFTGQIDNQIKQLKEGKQYE